MGKARAAATLVAISALALLVPAAGAAQEKSYSLPQAVVNVEIASDGSLLVREDITFSFSGSFSGAYRDIPLRANESIDLVAVSEKGRRYRPGGNTELGSFDRADTYGVERSDQRIRVVWHYRAVGGIRTFTIAYRFRGIAVAYDDVVDVNLQVWGSHWPTALYDLRATMELPRPIALQGTRYRVWGAPAWVNGVVERSRTGTSLRAVNIPAGQFVEMRTVFPRRLLTSTRGARSSTATASRASSPSNRSALTTMKRTAGRSTRRWTTSAGRCSPWRCWPSARPSAPCFYLALLRARAQDRLRPRVRAGAPV